jgi:hypothetical protein
VSIQVRQCRQQFCQQHLYLFATIESVTLLYANIYRGYTSFTGVTICITHVR